MDLLINQLQDYIKNPVPVFDSELAKVLAQHKTNQLKKEGVLDEEVGYTTTNVFHKRKLTKPALFTSVAENTYIELPDFKQLNNFYLEQGLELAYPSEFNLIDVEGQIKSAMALLDKVQSCGETVRALTRAVQVLKQPEPEFDVSYSHPDIPFTIFVSVGQKHSELDTIRLAEAILHETMHLKLTLIESHITFFNGGPQTFYSPWREEYRPVRGVLHGLYVFSAINDFLKKILETLDTMEQKEFVLWRIEELGQQFYMLSDFPNCDGITEDGATLSTNLLP